MTNDWSLKDKAHDIDKFNWWYRKEDIETLLQKLIEDVNKPCVFCEGKGCFECDKTGIDVIYDVPELIKNINKRFRVEK